MKDFCHFYHTQIAFLIMKLFSLSNSNVLFLLQWLEFLKFHFCTFKELIRNQQFFPDLRWITCHKAIRNQFLSMNLKSICPITQWCCIYFFLEELIFQFWHSNPSFKHQLNQNLEYKLNKLSYFDKSFHDLLFFYNMLHKLKPIKNRL